MGTNNLTIVYKNGKYKVAQYGQWNGYPEGLGCYLLNFLKKINMVNFKAAIDEVEFYTKEEIKELNESINKELESNPDFNWTRIYPHLSRNTGGEILDYILFKNYNKLENRLNFAANSLFCEWAYVIDLDANTFEVYEGFNKEALNETDRFFELEEFADGGYHPVKLVQIYNIDNLPDKVDFLADLTEGEEESSVLKEK